MNLTVLGGATRSQIEAIAKNAYTLTEEEYKILSPEGDENGYELVTETLRRFDPFVKAEVSPDRVSACLSFYPGINSTKSLSFEDVMTVLKERYKFESLYIKKEEVKKSLEALDKGFIVEKVPAVNGIPAENGKDAVLQIFFEKPSQKPKILPDGRVDYRNFTKFVLVRENDVLIKRTPPTPGTKGFDVGGAEIFPIPGKDKIVQALEGVSVNGEGTEYTAQCGGHVIYTGDTISVLPLLHIQGNVDYRTGNIVFDGTVVVSKDVLPGFSVTSDDIIVEGIDEDGILTARNSINIKVGIKGMGNKGFVKSGKDVSAGYAENARITAKDTIEIKKYCFNSFLAANKIFTSSSDAVLTGGFVRAFSLVHVHNLGTKGTNDMTVAVGISPEMEDRAKNLKAEIFQISETLKKIAESLSKVDLKNPAVLRNPKIRKLLETTALLKRKQPLLEAKLEEVNKKSLCDDPKIIVENIARAGVKIKFFNTQIELKTEMKKIEFFFDNQTQEIGFRTYGQ